jgi:hypothetical protein
LNQADGTDTVLDFSDHQFEIMTSPESSLTLDFDGQMGEFLEASGTFDISVYDFFEVHGAMAIEQYRRDFFLADGSLVNTNVFAVGANQISAFAGLGPAILTMPWALPLTMPVLPWQ